MGFTRGKRTDDLTANDHARVYDRLRKRSLRKKDAYQQVMFSAKYGLVSDEVVDAVIEDRCRFFGIKWGRGNDVAHQAYVRGVRDALASVEQLDEEWYAQYDTDPFDVWAGYSYE